MKVIYIVHIFVICFLNADIGEFKKKKSEFALL